MRRIATAVTRSVVCMSVCVLVTLMYCAKTAEPIWGAGLAHVKTGNHVLTGVKVLHGKGQFVQVVQPTKKH